MEGIKINRSILRGLSVIEAFAAVRAGYVRRETNGRQYSVAPSPGIEFLILPFRERNRKISK